MVCLQEMHFSKHLSPKFISVSYPQFYIASADAKHRGVLIAFHHTTPFTLRAEISDPEGRYIILTSHLLDTEVTVVSYYAPNHNPTSFLSHPLQVINVHKQGTLLICRDSNQVIYLFLDKSPIPATPIPSKLTFQHLLQNYSLLDSWREANLARRQYTHYSHPHKTYSHINYILLSTKGQQTSGP